MEAKVIVNDHLGGGASAGELTNEHATASYGLPVLVQDGRTYGSADRWCLLTTLDPAVRDWAIRAGWHVVVADPGSAAGQLLSGA